MVNTISLQRIIDKYVFGFICLLLGIFKRQKQISKSLKAYKNAAIKTKTGIGDKADNIAFIKLWAIGESVLTLPTIKAIKDRFPNSKTTVICRSANKPVFESLADSIILFEPKNIFSLLKLFKRFDVVVDLEPYLNISALLGLWVGKTVIGFSHGIRSKLYTIKVRYNDLQHASQTFADLLKPLGLNIRVKALEPLPCSKKDLKAAESFLGYKNYRKKRLFIGFHLGVGATTKQREWPVENFVSLAELCIKQLNATIVLTGSKSEIALGKKFNDLLNKRLLGTDLRGNVRKQVIDLISKTSIKELFCVLKLLDVFVSNDTGPMHISAAQGVATIGLFGPNTPLRYAPLNPKSVSIYKGNPKKPLIHPHKRFFNVPKEFDLMKKISVEEVFLAVREVLAHAKA